jgi:hypothetical protein
MSYPMTLYLEWCPVLELSPGCILMVCLLHSSNSMSEWLFCSSISICL